MLRTYMPHTPQPHIATTAAQDYAKVYRELCRNKIDTKDAEHGDGYKQLSALSYEQDQLEMELDYLSCEIRENGGTLPDHEDILWSCDKEDRAKILRFLTLDQQSTEDGQSQDEAY